MAIAETDKQQVEKIVRVFAEELVKQLGDQIYEVIWYGSTARGDAEEDSDREHYVFFTGGFEVFF
jgi:predicted nucleotidyltransferase